MPDYTRDEIDYATWYNDNMKQLAASFSADQLHTMLGQAAGAADRYSSNNSRRRNRGTDAAQQAWNTAAAEGQQALDIRGALEIHELFPEHAKSGEVK